ncbi:hypothetical protein MRB53_020676 [Persea americana]|uniref:Uncharacterized protein n=1 Tax=Persea americana TaxID=3435 RepID=A0ACC2L1L2_PERAE|nr:hypothetical protein MRB53_020676 [Persea americana]
MNEIGIASKLNEAQVLETGSSPSAFQGNKSREYEDPNAKNNAKEQMEAQMTDMISLFPQTPSQTHVLPKDNLPSGLLENPTREDQEKNQQSETGLSMMVESPHGPPNSDSDTQAADLKVGFKVSCWVTAISATGIISVIVGYLGNHSTSLTHKPLFKACVLSLSGSFLSGAGLFLLSIVRPNILGLIPAVKVVTWISMASMTLTVGLGTAIVLQTG